MSTGTTGGVKIYAQKISKNMVFDPSRGLPGPHRGLFLQAEHPPKVPGGWQKKHGLAKNQCISTPSVRQPRDRARLPLSRSAPLLPAFLLDFWYREGQNICFLGRAYVFSADPRGPSEGVPPVKINLQGALGGPRRARKAYFSIFF